MTDILREGYCVQYTCIYSGFACFQAITGVRDRLLRSTTKPIEIHFWDTAEAAAAWLDSIGYEINDPVPVGIGHMRIGVRHFAAEWVDPQWCLGSLFEVPAHLRRPRVALDSIPTPEPEPPPPPPVTALPSRDNTPQPIPDPPTPAPPKPRPYRPSNGSEGDAFEGRWCERCAGFFGGHCNILVRAFAHEIGEPQYPSEWVYGESGPTCTSFRDRATLPPPPPRKRIRPLAGQGSLF